jgi:hypothetical protein
MHYCWLYQLMELVLWDRLLLLLVVLQNRRLRSWAPSLLHNIIQNKVSEIPAPDTKIINLFYSVGFLKAE